MRRDGRCDAQRVEDPTQVGPRERGQSRLGRTAGAGGKPDHLAAVVKQYTRNVGTDHGGMGQRPVGGTTTGEVLSHRAPGESKLRLGRPTERRPDNVTGNGLSPGEDQPGTGQSVDLENRNVAPAVDANGLCSERNAVGARDVDGFTACYEAPFGDDESRQGTDTDDCAGRVQFGAIAGCPMTETIPRPTCCWSMAAVTPPASRHSSTSMGKRRSSS